MPFTFDVYASFKVTGYISHQHQTTDKIEVF